MERKYYSADGEKAPIWIQPILEKGTMTDIDFFHFTDMLDWSKQGDDMAVLEPLISCLAQWGDSLIIAFAEKMAELLYRLDTRELAETIYKGEGYFSGDGFLYVRCTALINGKAYYNGVVNGKRKLKADTEFEAILYAPMDAWSRCHGKAPEDFEYMTKYCYETGSNEEGWKK